jgi:hypothetical protein
MKWLPIIPPLAAGQTFSRDVPGRPCRSHSTCNYNNTVASSEVRSSPITTVFLSATSRSVLFSFQHQAQLLGRVTSCDQLRNTYRPFSRQNHTKAAQILL